MGRPQAEQQQPAPASAATIAANLVQALLTQLSPDGDGGSGSGGSSRAFVVGAEDVIQQTEAVEAADMLIVVHEAPYDLVCGLASGTGVAQEGAAADCRRRAQRASDLQSGLGLAHDGDMVLHLDGSALRSLAGAVMVVEELLERWGLDPQAVDDAKGLAGAALWGASRSEDGREGPAATDHAAAAGRRRCIDAVDGDVVCRAWHDFYYELFPATAPPVVDDDDASAWLPAALEAAAAKAAAAAAGAAEQGEAQPVPGTGAGTDVVAAKPNAWSQTDGAGEEDKEEGEEDLPQLFYCLPGGGLNDLTVEWWKCIEWAIQTGRTLVSGFENYLAAVPPYTPYFELKALPGLKTMSPAEAARRIRKARQKGQKVTVFPRRLQRDPEPILVPVSNSEEEAAAIVAGERPWRFDWDDLHHLGFEFEKEYGQQVVVFHRKGNVGA
jgi:hypothetical protein